MRYLTIFLSLICMLFVTDAAQADKRVAFVVGNGNYKNVAALPNPPIDAKAMADIRNVGFDVVEGTNLSRDTMTERLLVGKKAQGADIAVFFYAGHRHRDQRHQLSAAGRCRHQIRNGRQARRRDQH